MKHIHTFESFLNEATNSLAYWSDYAKDTSGQASKWLNDEARTPSEVNELVDLCIEYWNDEADGKENKVPPSSEKHIFDLAMQYFKQFKTINGNIVNAMIAQEA